MGNSLLIVDDNRDAADMLHILLTRKGFLTTTVYDGADALHAAGQRMPDLVLLDLGMPDMSGVEVARRLRLIPGGEGAVLVALSGWGMQEDLERTAQAGFNRHLVKPVTLVELLAVITDELVTKRAVVPNT